jgi:cytochrome c oxidase subunit II
VRRKLVAAFLVAAAVLSAGSWFGFSARQGLTPVKPASTGAEDIADLYLILGVVAVLILLSVAIPLALILGRYRERGLGREVEGPQTRGNTTLELTWTAIPVVIVLVIAVVALVKALEITDPAAATSGEQRETIAVEGRQFYWRFVYPNGVVSFDRLRVPVDRVVKLDVTAPDWDVAHSFWAPALGGKIDAIPGIRNHLKFRATRTGVFDGTCAELCGIQHGAMSLSVEVMSADEYERWLEEESAAQESGNSTLGQTIFDDVCSKCHFAAPEYAPNIIGNPILGDPGDVRRLVENGRGKMPPVGRDWSERELDALTDYLQTIAPPESDSGG